MCRNDNGELNQPNQNISGCGFLFNPHFVCLSLRASGNTVRVIIRNIKNREVAPLLMDLIKDTRLLIEEGEEKALVPSGFKPGTSRLQDHRFNHFATTNA